MACIFLNLKDPNHGNVSTSWDIIIFGALHGPEREGYTYAFLGDQLNAGGKVQFDFKSKERADQFIAYIAVEGTNIFCINRGE